MGHSVFKEVKLGPLQTFYCYCYGQNAVMYRKHDVVKRIEKQVAYWNSLLALQHDQKQDFTPLFSLLWLHRTCTQHASVNTLVLTEDEKGKMKYCRGLETAKLTCHPPHFSFALRCLSSYSLKATMSTFSICPQDVSIHCISQQFCNFQSEHFTSLFTLTDVFLIF